MAEIPKSYVPIKKVHLRKRVHKAVAANLSRSAIIAVQSRPNGTPAVTEGAATPIWGEIQHPGWSSPNSRDLPNVQYSAIIQELPHLLELEALALYTPSLSQHSDYLRTPMSGAFPPTRHFPDQEVLKRRPHVTFRTYIGQLVSMGFVRQDVADVFLAGYERARFRSRGEGIEQGEFMDLMRVFSGLLKSMGDDLVSTSGSSPASSQRQGRGWAPGEGSSYSGDDRSESVDLEPRYGHMSLGDETTTEEEEGGRLQHAPGRVTGERVASNPRSGMRRRRTGSSAMLERTTTTTTVGTGSVTEPEENGVELAVLSPRGNRRRLSVRASTGTFG